MIELQLNPTQEALRKEIRAWLQSNKPPQISADAPLSEFVQISREWQFRLAHERFVGVHFPEAYGGRGQSVVEEAVIQEELAKARAPQLVGLFGLTMVGPVLLRFGTDEQKSHYLQKILSAEEIWCQGFSEPEAGSDLASLKTEARPVGDSWEISGQKVWTSFAQYAKYSFLLARTDLQAPKHKGLTYFLLPMTSAGISVRPLAQITGEEEFNELFLDRVIVPNSSIVGKPGQGWDIAISTLMFERVILTFSRHLQSEAALAEIGDTLKSRGATDGEKNRFGSLVAKSMAVRALALSHLVQYNNERPPGPEGSLDKLFWSEMFQEIAKFAYELRGSERGFLDRNGEAAHRYLYSRGRTIAAGTSEIQRNIIAERLLSLPRR